MDDALLDALSLVSRDGDLLELVQVLAVELQRPGLCPPWPLDG
jgi:hypothetical protein